MPQLPATIIFIVSGEFELTEFELGFYCNTVIGGGGGDGGLRFYHVTSREVLLSGGLTVTFGILQYVREDLLHCTVLELTDAHV